jgi:cytochrome c551/c552
MPATESTWRNSSQLHRIFAVTGVLLTISTVWMFWKDHARTWKTYQVETNEIDLKMNQLRQEQYETGEAVVEHDRRATELAEAKATPIDPQRLDDFKSLAGQLNKVLSEWKNAGHPYSTVYIDEPSIKRDEESLAKSSGLAKDARSKANEADKAVDTALAEFQAKPNDKALAEKLAQREAKARKLRTEATKAETTAAKDRARLVAILQNIVNEARVREDKALGIRKFKSGEIDAAKANYDIAIRDNLPTEELSSREKRVNDLLGDMLNPAEDAKAGKQTLAALNEIFQSISDVRKKLEKNLKQITADEDAAQKAYSDSLAELDRLKKQHSDREETYLGRDWHYPWIVGRKILTLPILDAFNSPRKIDNLWSDGLTQNYNFSYVRRFDRCTTCHQSLVKTLPGTSASPAFVHEETFEMVVVPPSKEAPPKPRVDDNGEEQRLDLQDWLGLQLAKEGLLVPDDVTVALVMPNSPGAKAQIGAKLPSDKQANGLEIRQAAAALVSPPGEGENLYPTLAGLMVGDVIAGINGEELFGGNRGPKRVAATLVALAEQGKPIKLTVRRGLPNPYISHPRLDLYLTDSSPHRMQTFACTICHDGQGSATDFRWASHTPSTQLDMERWTKDHGWFDNPHWIYPMYARRFAESACLKCHHDVVELEPSAKYVDAPAPKVTHGYHLIRKYGCYGCHEVNGFDGPTRRVGPDLRSEPNYFAVAQQIDAELARARRLQASNDPRLGTWKEQLLPLTAQLAAHPEDNATRSKLKGTIEEGVAAAGKEGTLLDKSLSSLANMLKDVEAPGSLRRPGPSLRFLAKKLDSTFLYDWIADPQHFRPTTRMPRFFGLWDHLKDANGHMVDAKAPRLEPIEIRGILAYVNDYAADQPFEPETRPSGIDRWTTEAQLARGKTQFQTRGCLACHNHKDFPEVQKYRNPEEIVQGPDLSGVGIKFAKDRNPSGPDWLYSWIKNPTRYHARTVMPNLFLDPEKDPGADANDAKDDKWFDPADDIVTYLLSASTTDWQPIPAALTATQTLAEDDPDLKQLILEYLNEAFYKDDADTYYLQGIPKQLENELKGAEKDLVVMPGEKLTNEKRLKYIGRKTIAKYGCFGCHDIPGFEDAKPIGTGLADWGRKDPAKLAFEHIAHYIEHGHGHAAPHAESKKASASAGHADSDEFRNFYTHALKAGNRIGFIYQKLKEPRSYDFDKTENKRYNERLRMPQFPFTVEDREAVITFVLGLVADPPQQKYIFKAKERNAALIAGRQVLEKYNCGGCHILGLEKWQISYAPGTYGERPEAALYPFLKAHFSPQELAAAAKPDRRNELHSTLVGLPPTEKADGLPIVQDLDSIALDNGSPYAQRELKFGLELYQPTIVDGNPYLTGQSPVFAAAGQIDARYPTWGGVLTKYLLPVVTELERKANPNASGSEAYGWLPPPLFNEGNKVQTAWLHDFLLNPYPIRPATFLRMPRFNMSSSEATILANYFAAVDNAEFPYAYSGSRDGLRLAALEAEYVKGGAATSAGGSGSAVSSSSAGPPGMQRLDDAMKIIVNGNFCVKCHLVSDYSPTGSIRAKAPNLADVYRRLRPEYVRNWIANPKIFLPYTSMPVNIPFQDPPPILSQLYHGTNVEQVQALADLLMNYDQYARQSTRIADRVQPAAPEGAAPATGASSGSN